MRARADWTDACMQSPLHEIHAGRRGHGNLPRSHHGTRPAGTSSSSVDSLAWRARRGAAARSMRRRTTGVQRRTGAGGGLAPRGLLCLVAASVMASSDFVKLPPADEFSQHVDKAAASVGGGLSCHARDGLDLSGDAAYVWGLNFHVSTASQCCEACAAHRAMCGTPNSKGKAFWDDSGRQLRCGRGPGKCNAFVFCAAAQCFSYDIHVHRQGECWLKHESNITHPMAAGPTLPKAMREAPRRHWPWAVSEKVWPAAQPPERNQWQSGIIAEASNTKVWSHLRLPGWHKRFCNKHGPC